MAHMQRDRSFCGDRSRDMAIVDVLLAGCDYELALVSAKAPKGARETNALRNRHQPPTVSVLVLESVAALVLRRAWQSALA